MKVKLLGSGGAIGGIAQVYAGLYRYLPEYGVEFVDNSSEADVIHAHIALYEDAPVETPLVVSSHGMLWDDDNWGDYAWKINHMCIEAYRKADVITAPSEFVAQAVRRNMLRSPLVVRHGIDTEQWQPQSNQNYVLWNKARRDAASDPEALNKLAILAPNVKFISTFGNKASNVNIIGKQSIEDMHELVANAGVYLITPKESGGPCFGVLEAMACGVPVLSWNWGGTPEAVIHKETGYLAQPENYTDLLEGLQYCLQNRERLGTAAREYVTKHYQWHTVVKGYLDAYEQAINQQPDELVSVIVPCYNLGKFLPACVDSVLKQTDKNWELIIINDCSTDNSLEIAQRYADDPRITVFHNKTNKHVAETRNIGIAASRGSYILPLDADDRLAPDAIATLRKELTKSREYDICSGKLLLCREDDLDTGHKGEWPNNAEYKLQITGYNRLPYSSMYRRRVWENIGGYRSRIREGVEDADFWTRALSFGYKALVIDKSTLYYTMRGDSLGKKNVGGVDAWLGWFGWRYEPKNTPFGATQEEKVPVKAFDKPKVSIIIPVGPGHERHLQSCIDSLLSQTEQDWEAVVINDTGHPINTAGMPFITLIELDRNKGVAAARNVGIHAAKSDKIIFLDVDDVAQPHMVSAFLAAHKKVGGWIYSDWYANNGTEIKESFAKDWDIGVFINKMLGPITGLYEKTHLLEIGGFDESAPGWEDWDMQLSLVERGICGTRVVMPLLLYNMHYGTRREENFSSAENLLQYIKDKHKNLYTKRGNFMGCSRCGGKPSVRIASNAAKLEGGVEKVLLKYTGPKAQNVRYKSHKHRGVVYRVNNRVPFTVFADDVDQFLSNKNFERVSVAEAVPVGETPIIASQLPVVNIVRDIMELNLRPETYAMLEKHYPTVASLQEASETDLLAVKGIGPARLKEIKEALNAF